jgi:hypothetical protein
MLRPPSRHCADAPEHARRDARCNVAGMAQSTERDE